LALSIRKWWSRLHDVFDVPLEFCRREITGGNFSLRRVDSFVADRERPDGPRGRHGIANMYGVD
jgi:hypothetical protein